MDLIKRMVVCLICFVVMATVICIRVSAAEGDNIVTNAKAAVLIEAETGRVLYSKNADVKLPMASTTKIMTAILSLESGDPDRKFTVDPEAIKVEGSSMGLLEGDTVSKRDLLYGMLLPSGNDAANATAVAVSGSVDAFVALMNQKAHELGLNSTHFVTPSGLDDNTKEHYSTAMDMARLAGYAILNNDFRAICSEKSVSLDLGGRKLWLNNTNKLLGSCEGVFGIKTGFTDKAGRCLVTACERGDITLICVTLGDSTDWIDHEKLYDYGYSRLTRHKLGGESYKVPLAGDGGCEAELICPEFSVILDRSEIDKVEKKVLLPQIVYESERGTALGKAVYYLDGGIIAVIDLQFK